jgi:hypothetical protein
LKAVTLSGPVPPVHHAVQRETYFRGDFRGSGGVFANRPINLSAAECFSSAPISLAFSMKALDCSGSSRVCKERCRRDVSGVDLWDKSDLVQEVWAANTLTP